MVFLSKYFVLNLIKIIQIESIKIECEISKINKLQYIVHCNLFLQRTNDLSIFN